jgi:hypothetical protein
MDLAPLIPVVAIIAFAAVKIARMFMGRAQLPADVTARFEALERGVEGLQQELAETQERVDFAERMLASVREEKRIGGEDRAGNKEEAS